MTRARRLPWGYWLALLALAALCLGAVGCAAQMVTRTKPVLEKDALGNLKPVYDKNGEPVTTTETLPAEALRWTVQAELAANRKPYSEVQVDPDTGKVKKFVVWGENGRADMKDIDSDAVKIVKAVAPGATTLALGVTGQYFNSEIVKTMAGANRFSIENFQNNGGVFAYESNKGAGSYISHQQNPITTTTNTDDHSVSAPAAE